MQRCIRPLLLAFALSVATLGVVSTARAPVYAQATAQHPAGAATAASSMTASDGAGAPATAPEHQHTKRYWFIGAAVLLALILLAFLARRRRREPVIRTRVG